MVEHSQVRTGVVLALALVAGCANRPLRVDGAACPYMALGETAADCPWASVARAAAQTPSAELPHLLEQNVPVLWQALSRDGAAPAIGRMWARSRNADENTHTAIVQPELLAALGVEMGQDGQGDVVHAGLTHTYGYLLSTLRTPFGYKRARWVSGEIERGLGLAVGLLGPMPKEGTLLANVTCVLARLSLEVSHEEVCVSAAREVGTAKLPARLGRLVERARSAQGVVTLRTDWFRFSANRGLLVYSVLDSEGERLITAFPADDATWEKLTMPKTLGDNRPITTHYNAVIPGLTDSFQLGDRVVLAP